MWSTEHTGGPQAHPSGLQVDLVECHIWDELFLNLSVILNDSNVSSWVNRRGLLISN